MTAKHAAGRQRLFARIDPVAGAALLPAFIGAIFLSATLLFAVQPMFAKMTLPMLGGAPNVWNTAMVFFQATLLAGYAYAHFLSRTFALTHQIGIHLAVMIAGMVFLPLAVAPGWTPPTEGAQAFWLIGLFAVSIGAPFFALSANAPLLQHWFSRTAHKDAADPYFLYAASNAGSMLTLLSYPILIEPLASLSAQSGVWSAWYVVLFFMIGAAGVFAFARKGEAAPEVKSEETAAEVIPFNRKLLWIAYAFVPSSLMLGVTTHLSTDVAAAPMLWVAPLSLYLLTFIFVFSKGGDGLHKVMLKAQPAALIVVALLFPALDQFLGAALAAHLALFFIIAMVCHGELAKRRPGASGLTAFYLCMSIGGVLGGIFNALVAPVLFTTIIEYPLVLAAACLLRPWGKGDRKDLARDIAFPAALFGVIALLIVFKVNLVAVSAAAFLGVIGLIGFAAYTFQNRPLRLALGVGAAFLFSLGYASQLEVQANGQREVFVERSFFGVTKVLKAETDLGAYHYFVHGSTIHNVQMRSEDYRRTPLAYHYREGGFGQVMAAVRADKGVVTAGVVGAGTGALGCYAAPGDTWKFYEIDPAVKHIATTPSLFSYFQDCAPDAPLIMGDARLTLQKEQAGTFDILFMDAFSSDAVPAHLITKEAVALYQDKLKADGVLFFNVSNRYLDLASVVIRIAEDAGLGYRVALSKPAEDDPLARQKKPVLVIALAEEGRLETLLGGNPNWSAPAPRDEVGLWRDDFSNIVGAFLSKARHGVLSPNLSEE